MPASGVTYHVIGDLPAGLAEALTHNGLVLTEEAVSDMVIVVGDEAAISARIEQVAGNVGLTIACSLDDSDLLDVHGIDDVLRWPADQARLPARLRAWRRALSRLARHENVESQLAEELGNTGAFLSSVLDAMPDPVFVKDDEHRFIVVNRAFCDLMGSTREGLIGNSDHAFVPRAEADVFWAKDEIVFRTGEPNENEEFHTSGNGDRRVLVTKKARFVDARGHRKLVGIIRDVTERRRMEMQLAVSERMASLGTLAAGVAHEINNPLAYVVSNLEAVRAGLEAPQDDARIAIDDALDGATRIQDLVRELKSFSRIEGVEATAVDLAQVVTVAVRMLRNQLRNRARVVIDVASIPKVRANESRLAQVLVNLLVNAAEAFPTSGPTNEVHVTAREGEDHVRLVVRDNGPGIPGDVLPRVFDPFFTTKPVGVGTGLGLSICHGIVESFGGSIGITSEPGRGTRVTVTLPIAQAEAPRRESSRTETTPACRQVMIIDDEPLLARSFVRAIGTRHVVTTFASAEAALQVIAAGVRPEAILCDVMMPGLDGAGFHDRVRALYPELVPRIGFVTGGVFTDEASRFLDRVTNPRVQKPLRRADLLEVIEQLASASGR